MSLKRRADSLARIGRLASRMRELGRARLQAVEQEQASLNDDLRAVFEAFERGGDVCDAQAKLGARRIRALQRRLDKLSREFERARGLTVAQGVRAKLAEEAAERADRAHRDRQARGDLADLVERALRRREASHG